MFYSPEYLEEEQKSCRLHLSIFIFSVQPLLFLLKEKKKKTLSFLFQADFETVSSPVPLVC